MVSAVGVFGKVSIGTGTQTAAYNLVAYLNDLSDARLANYKFAVVGGGSGLFVYYSGGKINPNAKFVTQVVVGNSYSLFGSNLLGSSSHNGLEAYRVSALGTLKNGIIADAGGLTTPNRLSSGLDLGFVEDNKDFIGAFGKGKVGNFTATYSGPNSVALTLKVGDFTYSSASTPIVSGTTTSVSLVGTDTQGNVLGGSVVLNFPPNAVSSMASQSDADVLAKQINQAVSGMTIVQNRDINSFNGSGQNVLVNGVQTTNLNGATVDARLSNFDNVNVQDFSIDPPTTSSPNAIFRVVINGETFQSVGDVGSQIGINTIIPLQSLTNPYNSIQIVTGNNGIPDDSSVAIDVSTADKAKAAQDALQKSFGFSEPLTKFGFQTGSSQADTINVAIGSASTATLYQGQSLDLTTLENAQSAGDALDKAINSLTALRATIGSLESRFNYAGTNLQTSLSNLDKAAAEFLDTDISKESTLYAINKVRMSASISVLAQANHLLQSLLKLMA